MTSLTRKFTIASLIAVLFASAFAVQAQEFRQIKRLGTSEAVCPGGVETAQELQQYFANNEDKVRAILSDSGWAGDADAVIAAVAAGDLVETSYPTGTRMAWMGAKVKGNYVAKPYIEWAGNKSFEAFKVNVSSDCQVYELAIPKACCNVALIGVSPDTSDACVAPVAVVEDQPVVEEVAAPLALIPFFGAFVGTETRPRYEAAWDMDMRDSSGVVGLRAGLLKEISEKSAVFGQLSYYDRNGINDGNTYPEDNLAIDIGLERKLGEKAFIGGGIGAWNVDDSDYRDASLFGHVGGDIGASSLQWFLEGRIFDSDSDNHDSISDNKMFSAGIRYLVK